MQAADEPYEGVCGMTWTLFWMVLERGGWVVVGAFLWNITMFEERCEEARQDGITMGQEL